MTMLEFQVDPTRGRGSHQPQNLHFILILPKPNAALRSKRLAPPCISAIIKTNVNKTQRAFTPVKTPTSLS